MKSLIVRAGSCPGLCEPLCPSCYREERKRYPKRVFDLFFGETSIRDGALAQCQKLEFSDIARMLEESLTWLVEAGAIQEGGEAPAQIVTENDTIELATVKLYDYIHEKEWIPHWKSQIEFIEGRIQRDTPTGGMLGELKNRIEFFRWRIEQTMRPAAPTLGPRQWQQLNRLKRMEEAWIEGKEYVETEPPVFRVSWELLKPSGDTWKEIIAYYDCLKQLDQFKHKKRDDSRLALMYEPGPDRIFIGTSEFNGYIAFIFDRAKMALLESAFLENALYALPSENWRELSSLSKTELLESSRPDVERVIHSPTYTEWRRKLQRSLMKWGIVP